MKNEGMMLMGRTIIITTLILLTVAACTNIIQPMRNATVTVAFTNLENELITVLSQTKRTLDAAVYDLTLDSVFDALQNLNVRGVTVRIVLGTGGGGGQKELELCRKLDALDKVEVRRRSNMHHKFAILDGATTLTGSTNWTRTSTKEEANNLVVIHSSEIATQYEAEFERLWGSVKNRCQ